MRGFATGRRGERPDRGLDRALLKLAWHRRLSGATAAVSREGAVRKSIRARCTLSLPATFQQSDRRAELAGGAGGEARPGLACHGLTSPGKNNSS